MPDEPGFDEEAVDRFCAEIMDEIDDRTAPDKCSVEEAFEILEDLHHDIGTRIQAMKETSES